MRFALHDLDPSQFEALVVEVCHELLGAGIQGFAAGADGGRDAKFVGTAQVFPSQVEPLRGITIVQAKHTTNPVGKFSDPEFSSAADYSVLSQELPRIRQLRQQRDLDNYLLFANRRLGAIANDRILSRIHTETRVASVWLMGIEQIERYIKRYPFLATTIRSFEYDRPLRASPDDLAEVITALADAYHTLTWPKDRRMTVLERTEFKRKNELNGLSAEYAAYITRNFLKNFGAIDRFLSAPANSVVHERYSDAVDEFSEKLAVYRNDFATYDRILEYLLSLLLERDVDLAANKRLTRTVVYYMYWSCDIGAVGDGEHVDAD